jgi:hypothetical protein
MSPSLPHSVYICGIMFVQSFTFRVQNILSAQCRFCFSGYFATLDVYLQEMNLKINCVYHRELILQVWFGLD